MNKFVITGYRNLCSNGWCHKPERGIFTEERPAQDTPCPECGWLRQVFPVYREKDNVRVDPNKTTGDER